MSSSMSDDGFDGLRTQVESLVKQHPRALDPDTVQTKFGFSCFAAEWLHFTWCRGSLPRAHCERIVEQVRQARERHSDDR